MKIDSVGIPPAVKTDEAQVSGSFAGRSLSQVPSRQAGVASVAELGRWLSTQVTTDHQIEQHLQRLIDGDTSALYERQVRRP